METSFSEIKQKDVINLKDGKKLGKPFDLAFTYPEGKVVGIVVPGKKGFCFFKKEIFIDLKHIVKIGEDAILVDASPAPPPPKDKRGCPPQNNIYDYE